MQEYPSTVMKNQWGQIADEALREPVSITKHGRVSHVVMSNHEYEEYQKLKRAAFLADVNAKLEEGIKAADNGEFTTMTVSEIAAEAEKEMDEELKG